MKQGGGVGAITRSQPGSICAHPTTITVPTNHRYLPSQPQRLLVLVGTITQSMPIHCPCPPPPSPLQRKIMCQSIEQG